MERITEATENYLETILILSRQMPEVHAIDVCTELGYSRPTVSVYLKGLREKGLIEVDGSNHLWLTEQGQAIAERIYERHNTLIRLLEHLGVSAEAAAEDACKIEHDISDTTFRCIREYLSRLPQDR